MNPRVVIIAQARMGSTRLPGKVMARLAGKPVIDHVIGRLHAVRNADTVVIATTVDPSDDLLCRHIGQAGVTVVRGSTDDVLGRYEQAADEVAADVIVRVTCDCPVIDAEVVERVIEAYLSSRASVDYCSNIVRRTYPIGMDTEVFSRHALDRASADAKVAWEREHVTVRMYQHPDEYRIENVAAPPELTRPGYRLVVDEADDMAMLEQLLALCSADPTLAEMIAALDKRPDVLAMNASVQHREVWRPSRW